jgi:hypothetical protein
MTKFVLTLILLFSLIKASQVRAETAENSDAKPYLDNDVIVDPASVNQYKNNFGKLVFDKDEPVW